MSREDYTKAKQSYLDFFQLDYSLPVHIENLATCYLAEGNRQKAKTLYVYLSKKIQKNNISANGVYNLACIYALEGDKDKALAYLENAIALGFPKPYLNNDEDLKSLRDDKRFKELLK